MTTTEIPVLVEIEAEGVAESLRAAADKLDDAGEVGLDFASVRRIDANALKAMAALADEADKKAVKLVLRGAFGPAEEDRLRRDLAHQLTYLLCSG
jgi:anti-anti-sigma regulatory factor